MKRLKFGKFLSEYKQGLVIEMSGNTETAPSVIFESNLPCCLFISAQDTMMVFCFPRRCCKAFFSVKLCLKQPHLKNLWHTSSFDLPVSIQSTKSQILLDFYLVNQVGGLIKAALHFWLCS